MVDDLKDDQVQRIQGNGMEWVEIASAGADDEARIIAGFLESEGIPAQIEDVKFTEAPAGFGAMGDIRIYVSAEDQQKAMQLIAQRRTQFESLDVDGETVVTDEGSATIDDDAESVDE